MLFFNDQPTQEQRETLAEHIVEMPSRARLLDQYAGVVARARAAGVAANECDALEAKIGEAWSALSRFNGQVIGYARKWAQENPGTEGAKEIENALASVALNGYSDKVIALTWMGAFAAVAAAAAAALGVIPALIALAVIVVAALAAMPALFDAINRALKTANAPSINPDGSTNPTITDVARQGMNTIAVVATLAALSFGAYLFTRRPRRARA